MLRLSQGTNSRRTLYRIVRWIALAAAGAATVAAVAPRPTAVEKPLPTGVAARPSPGHGINLGVSFPGVPSDPQPTCTVTAAQFAGWFQSGSPSLNGVVNPADSIHFPNVPNCSFYQWSEQMFLWVTSPSPPAYGGDGLIFNSPAFYDVSPPDANHQRTLIPHATGRFSTLALRSAKAGRNGLQLIFDKSGKAFEVQPPQKGPSGKQLILNQQGVAVEIASSRMEAGKPVFLDKAGKVIANPRPVLPAAPRQEKAPPPNARLAQPPTGRLASGASATAIPSAQKFVVGGRPVFLNLSGGVVDTEEGQADNSVLMAQNGSLVYYITMFNDVNAYFATGLADLAFSATQFPTTQAALNPIVAFAAAHGKTFPDAVALTVELKTAWVETTGLPNPGSYLTMKATIPTYNKSNPNHWVANGQTTTTLALASMHFVASAFGHPEMIWATFEHFANAPDATYSYNSTSGSKTVNQSTAGTWLLAANGTSGPFNQAHMTASGADVIAVTGQTIDASNTLRMKPWGAASNQPPNPLVTAAASNTEIISINNSVLGQLTAGDPRINYRMRGAGWTINGASPTNPFPSGNEVGTSQLANTMLETYGQGPATFSTSTNCFFCHTNNTIAVSHVFNQVKPLF